MGGTDGKGLELHCGGVTKVRGGRGRGPEMRPMRSGRSRCWEAEELGEDLPSGWLQGPLRGRELHPQWSLFFVHRGHHSWLGR